jgi:hypothetical protein
MPTSVLPIQPSLGYGIGVSFDEVQRIYPDLSYRRYLKSSAVHKTRSLNFDELTQTEYDSIEAFFIARKQATSPGDQFFVYDPNVVNSVDPTGGSSTGRHTAIFLDSGINFTREDQCSYSGTLNVLFLD